MTTRSIKSLQIGMHWFPERAGGLDRMYYSLVGALPGAGVAVRGVVAGSSRVAEDTDGAIRGFGSAAQSLPRRLMAARRALRDAIDIERPDVISSHFALYTFPGLDVTRGIPQVSHFQGPWADESHVEGADSLGQRAKRYLEQAVYSRSSRLIVLSDAFGKILTSRYGISPERIRVVPGCVNVEQFNLPVTPIEARLKLQLPLGRPIVLAVRRLVRRMGLEDLVDAVKLLKRQQPDVLLLIAGKGRLEAELQARIDEAGLADNVKLLGFVPDQHLATLYRAATISVVPTVALEGFGLITVESLASGTPVLVTPVGGLPEAVAGLSQDLVLPSTGAEAIASGLAAALDGSLRLPDADACRAYARENFDNAVIAKRVASVYDEAIAAGSVLQAA
ncbi:glycosyltransferase family 4 protein [Paraburkholderia saeva]|uniref:D-inositol 3-phosphate glycosyltransferase n=1 Tax=Paraburkholderia saeva TaxID=2777537 RepID=A0A9N8X4D1_9BURK|nr:glycosyltransferase [Paraburkholderia saeva]CAG4892541.1 D-inositol 3-phosphate glycosyltransferase [Paraburkholderia saeva]CAG4920845.1 D-inositol 3-phosphate glycosyltransferase [Paraburkholderia saeva]CAG4923656.1 D-inositol 3-phosphate glycosyltransferase [Paraburkholderia saeva]